MKKFIAILLTLALMLTFAACGGTPATDGTDGDASTQDHAEPTKLSKLDQIKSAGKLVVGTSADFAPYEFHVVKDGKDTIVGFDMSLAKAIADDLGVTLEIKDISFDSILLDLASGSIDLGIAGFSPDAKRKETVDFSELYYEGGQSLVIAKANADKYKTYADFKGLQVGAQTGSIQADLLTANTPDAQAVLLQKVPDIILELLSGKIEGAFIETIVLKSYQKNYPELMELCPVEYENEGSAVAIAKGNDDLMEAVNAVVAKVVESGKMGEWVAEAQDLSDQAAA
ncbi:MAG: transporter substrate-binding domain-containing protein [Oscillospiraceae bacterium]